MANKDKFPYLGWDTRKSLHTRKVIHGHCIERNALLLFSRGQFTLIGHILMGSLQITLERGLPTGRRNGRDLLQKTRADIGDFWLDLVIIDTTDIDIFITIMILANLGTSEVRTTIGFQNTAAFPLRF